MAALPASTKESPLRTTAGRAAPRLNIKESQPRSAGKGLPRVKKSMAANPERNRNQEQGQEQERNRTENRADGERDRTGQAERTEQGKGERSARTERENRGVQGEESRGRETEFGRAREKVKMPAAQEAAGASPASPANKGPGFTASWFATPQSSAITAEMWISLSRSGAGFRIPSNLTIRPRKSCRSIRYSRATKSWCSTT